MKNISKASQNAFIKNMKNQLLDIGAVPFVSDPMQFDLNTKHGILWIRIDSDNTTCYTSFARFVDPKKAPDVQGVNSWSGKFNQHLSGNWKPKEASSLIVSQYKNLLN